MFKLPVATVACDQTTFGIFAACQGQHFPFAEGGGKVGNCIADQEWFLLPVIAQKNFRSDSTEKW